MSRYKSPIRTPQEWQHIVQDFYRSGLSSSEFCKLHNINIKTFGSRRLSASYPHLCHACVDR
ncbi:IS66 family insertion sequence element accessory protein TnpA [Vibrio jasicida]|uniref:IS66 family insertion sequence element accessory protein TnpA n=1 Tax=Vibrio jasicida TaxID=766224 RepID=UPI0039E0BB2F